MTAQPVPSLPGVEPARSLRKRRPRRPSSWRWLVHGLVVAFMVSWFLPILGLLISSVRTQGDTATSGWWMAFARPLFTGYNYQLAWEQTGIAASLATSLAITIPTTILTPLLSVIGAYALTRMRFAGRTALSLLLVGLLVIPPQITLVPLLRVYNEIGIAGTIPGIWLYQVGFTVPYGTFLLRGFLSAIPGELFEAASVDGASQLRVFRSIVLPLAMPVVASLAIIQFLWSWNDLLIPLIFLGGSGLTAPSTVQVAGLAQQTTQGQGPLMAATFLAVAIPLIIVLSLQRYLVRGILGGAVKG